MRGEGDDDEKSGRASDSLLVDVHRAQYPSSANFFLRRPSLTTHGFHLITPSGCRLASHWSSISTQAGCPCFCLSVCGQSPAMMRGNAISTREVVS